MQITVGKPGSQISGINTQLSSMADLIAYGRASATIGIARGAMIAIAAEDRFAVTLGGAGFDGEATGNAAATYKLAPRLLLFAGYARSLGENLIKAGISLSFP